MSWFRIPAKPPFGLAPLPLAVAILSVSCLPELLTALPSLQDTRHLYLLQDPRNCTSDSNCSSLETCDVTRKVCICEWGEIVSCQITTQCTSTEGSSESPNCGTQTTTCMKCTYDDELVAAAQIALGAGLVFVIAAIGVLMCRTYLRWRYPIPARRLNETDSDSLNSVQRWVISRMRDRPPGYDEPPVNTPPPNRTAPDVEVDTGTDEIPEISMEIIQEPSTPPQYEKPPPYESTGSYNASEAPTDGDLSDVPPPAYIDVVSPTSPGIANAAYSHNEESPVGEPLAHPNDDTASC